MTQDSVVSGLLQKIADFEVQNEDVFVASFPKSGTTWLQQVVYLLCNPNDNQSQDIMEDKFPYLEHIYPGLGEIQKRFGQKRFIKTHLPFHLLPKQITEKQKQAKVIYIYRDPKDVIVSYYYFARMLTYVAYTGKKKELFSILIKFALISLFHRIFEWFCLGFNVWSVALLALF